MGRFHTRSGGAFGPSTFVNHQQALFKLQQTTTVSDYQKEFERLSNRVTCLSPRAILDCFISGLHVDIKNELALLKPTTIADAIGMAKLVESKLLLTKQHHYIPKPYSSNSAATHSGPNLPNPNTPLLTAPPARLALPAPPAKNPMSVRRLSPTEKQVRGAKGLCFNCDGCFTPGH